MESAGWLSMLGGALIILGELLKMLGHHTL
jgi:hypothetical protein